MFNDSYLVRQRKPNGYRRRQSGLYEPSQPGVRLFTGPHSGQAQLSPYMLGKKADCWYLPSDLATGTGAWAARVGGVDIALKAGTPTYDVPSLLGVSGGSDVLVKCDLSTYWQDSTNTTLGNMPAYTDGIFEILLRPGGTNGKVIAAKRDSSLVYGWMFYWGASDLFRSYFQTASINTNAAAAAQTEGSLVLIHVVMDRSGSQQIYVNSAASGSADSIAAGEAESTAQASSLTLGAYQDGTVGHDGWLGSFSMWTGVNLLPAGAGHTAASVQAAIKERFQQWCGIYPQLGAGPCTVTRATTKYYYIASQNRLHLAGAGMIVVDESGVHIEGDATNTVLKNQAVGGGAPWVIRGSTTVTDDTAETTDPNGGNKACKVVGLGAAGVNDFYQSASSLGTSNAVAPAFWIKRISTSGTLALENNSIAGGGLWSIDMSALPAGWVRITRSSPYITVSEEFFSSVPQTCFFAPYCSAGGTVDFYMYNPFIEGYGKVEASSDIVTGAAAVTRNADDVDADSAIAERLDLAREGTIRGKVLLPNYNTAGFHHLFYLSDGTSSNRIAAYVHPTDDYLVVYMAAGGVEQAALFHSIALTDGVEHDWSVSYRTDRLSVIVDGVEVVDTDCDIPTGLDELLIGRDTAQANYLGGHLRDVVVDYEALH